MSMLYSGWLLRRFLKFTKAACVFIALNQSGAAFSDEPLSAPNRYKTCSSSVDYCALLTPNADVKIYQIDENFKSKFTYTVPGWHRQFFLSDDGIYTAIGYPGLSLVNLGANKGTVILTILKNGKKHREITLGEILTDIKSLERTASHYYWGKNLGFYPNGFMIETVEKKFIVVDPATGTVSIAG